MLETRALRVILMNPCEKVFRAHPAAVKLVPMILILTILIRPKIRPKKKDELLN